VGQNTVGLGLAELIFVVDAALAGRTRVLVLGGMAGAF